MALHAPHDGVHVVGHAPRERLTRALRRARVLLAPLRFGAGLKGKVLDAWAVGTPVVTTPIGAEGFGVPREDVTAGPSDAQDARLEHDWGGLGSACDAHSFAADAVRLHEDATLFGACQRAATRLREELFAEAPRLAALRDAVECALAALQARRATDYYGAALWHHRQRSTEYLAKYIEAKEAARKR